MYVITINSLNPNYSFLIGKNPNSPPRSEPVRKGNAVGWYKNGYNIAFIEGHDEVSFGFGEFEYLDKNKFIHPFIFNKCIDVLLDKLYSQYDGEFPNEIRIGAVRLTEYQIKTLESHFKYLDFEFNKIRENIYNVTISNTGRLEYLLDSARIIFFYLSLKSDSLYIEESIAVKYVDILVKIDAPYFIRYLYKCFLAKNQVKKFEAISDKINKSDTHTYNITPFRNWEDRFNFVKSKLTGADIVDIGCAQGLYITRLASSVAEYHAVDIDNAALEKAQKRCASKKLENVTFYSDYLEVDFSKKDVILSEVIEHDVNYKDIIINILKCGPNKLIITTPNKDFNHFYEIDDLRHEDHKFELTLIECDNLPIHDDYTRNIQGIGDTVDSVSTTTGIVYEKK